MAKIIEDIIIVKFSKLAKDSDEDSAIQIDNSLRELIESSVQGLVESHIIVEVDKK